MHTRHGWIITSPPASAYTQTEHPSSSFLSFLSCPSCIGFQTGVGGGPSYMSVCILCSALRSLNGGEEVYVYLFRFGVRREGGKGLHRFSRAFVMVYCLLDG